MMIIPKLIFLNSKYDNISYTISNYPTYSGAVRHGVEVAKTDFCCIYNADGSLYLIVWKICMNLPINLTSYIALGIKKWIE